MGTSRSDLIQVIVLVPDGRVLLYKTYNPRRMFLGCKYSATFCKNLNIGTPDKRAINSALFSALNINLDETKHSVQFLLDFNKSESVKVYVYVVRLEQMVDLKPSRWAEIKAMPYDTLLWDSLYNAYRYTPETRSSLEMIEITKARSYIS